jgi:hypothetical protein
MSAENQVPANQHSTYSHHPTPLAYRIEAGQRSSRVGDGGAASSSGGGRGAAKRQVPAAMAARTATVTASRVQCRIGNRLAPGYADRLASRMGAIRRPASDRRSGAPTRMPYRDDLQPLAAHAVVHPVADSIDVEAPNAR